MNVYHHHVDTPVPTFLVVSLAHVIVDTYWTMMGGLVQVCSHSRVAYHEVTMATYIDYACIKHYKTHCNIKARKQANYP